MASVGEEAAQLVRRFVFVDRLKARMAITMFPSGKPSEFAERAAHFAAPFVGNGDDCESRAPRTLIVSWHWPPTNRASAGGLGNLFGTAPPGVFRVLTRSFPEQLVKDHREVHNDLDARVPPTFVDWPGDDQAQPTMRTCPTLIRTLFRFLKQSDRIDQAWGVERVLAVYPHRLSMLVGWRIAGRLHVPLVLYMRDLCAESLTFRNPVRRRFWTAVDRTCLSDAWMILVPTAEFADHYNIRGIDRCWVLPHSVPENVTPTRPPASDDTLHLIYSGALYDAHADAAHAFVSATKQLDGVRITYLTQPDVYNGMLEGLGARWLPHREAMDTLHQADAFVLFLGKNTPFPAEIQGCFPSKLIDYLSIGRPILAIVPPGCFVDRFLSQTGCGIVVRQYDEQSIRSGIKQLADAGRRKQMALAAVRAVKELRSERWMSRLLERLREGPVECSRRTSMSGQQQDAFGKNAATEKRSSTGNPAEEITSRPETVLHQAEAGAVFQSQT